MGILDKIFGWGKSDDLHKEPSSELTQIRFGRYSDNNKTKSKTDKWYVAEDRFKEKKWNDSLVAFFDYLRDEKEDNVIFHKTQDAFEFEIHQGTKIVHGKVSDTEVTARVSLARMEKPSIPVMRRLLEMNYSLFYCRFALEQDTLCMLFDSSRDISSPSKLYYGLKELATKADKQDDLLVTDFTTLQSVDDTHVRPFSPHEIEVKYTYFHKWIKETLDKVDSLNQDSFSGGIAYLLLTLLYRIDFLIVPEGKLLNEIERINGIYWNNKEEKTAVERNQMLKEAFRKLLAWPKEEVIKYFYRAKATFSVTVPKPYQEVIDSIRSSKENSIWYSENKYEDIALRLLEYGLSFPQFSFSLPKPVTELFTLLMQILNPEYFRDLGFSPTFLKDGKLQQQAIETAIQKITTEFPDKYPLLKVNLQKLNYSSVLAFTISLLTEMETLNFETK